MFMFENLCILRQQTIKHVLNIYENTKNKFLTSALKMQNWKYAAVLIGKWRWAFSSVCVIQYFAVFNAVCQCFDSDTDSEWVTSRLDLDFRSAKSLHCLTAVRI